MAPRKSKTTASKITMPKTTKPKIKKPATTRRKSSEPCYFYPKGRCRYTDETCRFAHVLPQNLHICYFYPTGRCRYTDETCRFYHILPQSPDKATTGSGHGSDTSSATLSLGGFYANGNEGDKNFLTRGPDSSLPVIKEKGVGDCEKRKEPPYSRYARVASSAETINFPCNSAWDMKKLEEGGIKHIRFGSDFDVKDTHLAAICCRPDLASSLLSLSLGDTDSGNGGSITDHGVIILVRACPNLHKLILNATTRLTDEALLAICEACPSIENICITGHDQSSGKLTSHSLQKLTDSPWLAPKLTRLSLWDQSLSDKKVKLLSCARPKLTIETGETLGDGIAANMVAGMIGGAQTSTWRGGRILHSYIDEGWYGNEIKTFSDIDAWDHTATEDEIDYDISDDEDMDEGVDEEEDEYDSTEEELSDDEQGWDKLLGCYVRKG